MVTPFTVKLKIINSSDIAKVMVAKYIKTNLRNFFDIRLRIAK